MRADPEAEGYGAYTLAMFCPMKYTRSPASTSGSPSTPCRTLDSARDGAVLQTTCGTDTVLMLTDA